jgi:hypothetical protein
LTQLTQLFCLDMLEQIEVLEIALDLQKGCKLLRRHLQAEVEAAEPSHIVSASRQRQWRLRKRIEVDGVHVTFSLFFARRGRQ